MSIKFDIQFGILQGGNSFMLRSSLSLKNMESWPEKKALTTEETRFLPEKNVSGIKCKNLVACLRRNARYYQFRSSYWQNTLVFISKRCNWSRHCTICWIQHIENLDLYDNPIKKVTEIVSAVWNAFLSQIISILIWKWWVVWLIFLFCVKECNGGRIRLNSAYLWKTTNNNKIKKHSRTGEKLNRPRCSFSLFKL